MKKQVSTKGVLFLVFLVIILIGVITLGMMKSNKESQEIAQRVQQLNEELKQSTTEEDIVKSLPEISCWGDGLTTGSSFDGSSYPSRLAELTGLTVHNMGVSLEGTQLLS